MKEGCMEGGKERIIDEGNVGERYGGGVRG